MFVCLFPFNLGDLKSHDHETWHVGPISDVDVHGRSGILIFGRVPPQAHAACFFKSHDHEAWHVGPLNDEELHGLSGLLFFGRVAPPAYPACLVLYSRVISALISEGLSRTIMKLGM